MRISETLVFHRGRRAVWGMALILLLVLSGGTGTVEAASSRDSDYIWFEVLPPYTVTFSEADGLEGVTIQVYADSNRTVHVKDPLTTDSRGEATIDLGDRTYWFRATSAHANYEGQFTVHGADARVEFEMATSPTFPPTPRCSLAIAVEGGGTVTPYVGTQTHPEGTGFDLVAVPVEGWHFKQWSGDVIGTAKVIQVTLADDMALTAHFVEEAVSEIDRATVVTDPEKGGSLGVNGMIQVTLPPGATADKSNLTIIVYDSDSDIEELQQGTGFRVTVTDEEGQPIRRFSQPLTLAFTYDPDAVTEQELRNLMIHYYDEDLETWIPLPTTVDHQRGTLTCQTSHLTLFALLETDRLDDITGHWGEADVLRLQAIGAISGYPDRSFRPENSVDREQFARMLVDTAGIEVPSAATLPPLAFADADSISDWAKPYVEAAVRHGLIQGYEDNTFRPHANVTRIQVAVMLCRALGLTPGGVPGFIDADEIPAWGVGHVAALSELDIIRGIPSNIEAGLVFDSHLAATRSQAAAFLSRYLSARLGNH